MAKVFEFYFNPKARENTTCESFIFEPENDQEKRIGSLYMVGELNNLLPQNAKLLEKLATLIKNEYYAPDSQKTAEQALREGLKKANEFLNQEAKGGNVNWLGNLNFAILSLNDFILNFTKVGTLKILLKRGRELLDIGQNLESQNTEPYPLKLFGNIAIGKLSFEDRLYVSSRGVFNCFEKFNLLKDILEIQEEKELKKILRTEKDVFKNLSGICLLVDPGTLSQKKNKGFLLFGFPKLKMPFSFLRTFLYLLLLPLKVIAALLKKIRKPALSLPEKEESTKTPKSSFNFTPSLAKKRWLLTFIGLALLLGVGFLIFNKDKENEEYRTAKTTLEEARAKAIWAESALSQKEEDKANALLQEAWNKILPLTQKESRLKDDVISLKNSIEEKLNSVNRLEKIDQLEPVFTLNPGEINIVPKKMFMTGSEIVFFNPLSESAYKLNLKNKKGFFLKTNSNLALGVNFFGSPLFFSNPNILLLSDGRFVSASFQPAENDLTFGAMASFGQGLYFLDNTGGEVVRYSLAEFEEGGSLEGAKWIVRSSKKMPADAIDGEAMAVDGNVWILTKENKIDRYYTGTYRETFTIDIFPYLENPAKIWTSQSLPYLYILEPSKKRIVVLTKHGEVAKQYQSELFDDLLDFTVSSDGKTIYLLNGLLIYQISAANY